MHPSTGVTEQIGRYHLLHRLAAGGMGEVYLARLAGPVGFEKLLVIKRLLAQRVDDLEFHQMFFAEAKLAALLQHGNIVQTYELGETGNGDYFIAMEFVQGQSLHQILSRAAEGGEAMPPRLVVDAIAQACSGLAYAHTAQTIDGRPLDIVHRDVSPSNLLISYTGELKVIDFGIALSEESERRTIAGQVKGKIHYMSPEQCKGEPLDHRTDIFSLGICLYEGLALRNPFKRNTLLETLKAITEEDAPLPEAMAPSLAGLKPVLERALAKRREDRFSSCEEMRVALLACRDALPPADESLASYLTRVFAKEREDSQRLLQSLTAEEAGASKTHATGQEELNLDNLASYGEEREREGETRTLAQAALSTAATRIVSGSEALGAALPDSDSSASLRAVKVGAVGMILFLVFGGLALWSLSPKRDSAPAPGAEASGSGVVPPQVSVALSDASGSTAALKPPEQGPPEAAHKPDPDAPVEPERNHVSDAPVEPDTPGPAQKASATDEGSGAPRARTRRGGTKPRVETPTRAILGRLTLLTSPPTPTYLDGRTLTPATSVTRKRSVVTVGSGDHAVRLSIRVRDQALLVRVEEPSSVEARFDGARLGAVPTSPLRVEDRGTFQFTFADGRRLVAQVKFARE